MYRSPRISADMYLALSCPPSFDPLFPKLRSLMWLDAQPEAFTFLRLMLSPSVTNLNIHHCSNALHVLGLVAILGTVCPHLKHLEWINADSSRREVSLLSEAVTSCNELQGFTCCSLDGQAIQHLSSLQSLYRLCIIVDTSPLPPLHEPAFPGLKSINLTSPHDQDLSAVATFIRGFHSSPMSFCSDSDESSETSLLDLTKAVSTNCDRTRLEIFFVNEIAQEPGFVLDKAAFIPLFPFHNLTGVHVKTRRNVHLDDAAMLEMANAWPNLSELDINERRGWRQRSGVTLLGLRTILQRLPKLTALGIALDAETTVVPGTLNGDNSHRFSVTGQLDLDFLDSHITADVAGVATFLSELFPDIDGKHRFYAWSHIEGPDFDDARDMEHAIHSERWENVWGAMVEMKGQSNVAFN